MCRLYSPSVIALYPRSRCILTIRKISSSSRFWRSDLDSLPCWTDSLALISSAGRLSEPICLARKGGGMGLESVRISFTMDSTETCLQSLGTNLLTELTIHRVGVQWLEFVGNVWGRESFGLKGGASFSYNSLKIAGYPCCERSVYVTSIWVIGDWKRKLLAVWIIPVTTTSYDV